MLQEISFINLRNEKFWSPHWSNEGAAACLAAHDKPLKWKRRNPGLVYKLVLSTGHIKMTIHCQWNEDDSEVCFLLCTLSTFCDRCHFLLQKEIQNRNQIWAVKVSRNKGTLGGLPVPAICVWTTCMWLTVAWFLRLTFPFTLCVKNTTCSWCRNSYSIHWNGYFLFLISQKRKQWGVGKLLPLGDERWCGLSGSKSRAGFLLFSIYFVQGKFETDRAKRAVFTWVQSWL